MKKLAFILLIILIIPLAQASILDWNHKVPVFIHSSALEDLEEYQFSFEISTKSLINIGKLNRDCSDLRFTTASGLDVPHWVKNCNSQKTEIWIRPPMVNSLDKTLLYMYYGNPNAAPQGNPDEVFEFFDEFDSFDESKWVTNKEHQFQNSKIRLYNSEIISKQKFSEPMHIIYRVDEPDKTIDATFGFAFPNSSAKSNFKIMRTILSDYQAETAHISTKLAKGSYTHVQGIRPSAEHYQDTEVILKFIGNQIAYVDSVGDKGTLIVNVVIDEPFTFSFFAEDEQAEIDRVFIKKYLPTYYNFDMTFGPEVANINLPPIIELVYPKPGEYSKQTPITFTVSAEDPEEQALEYTWNFGNDELSKEASPTYAYANAGKYTVTITVNDGAQEVTESVSITITDDPYEPNYSLIYLFLGIIIGLLVGLYFLKLRLKHI